MVLAPVWKGLADPPDYHQDLLEERWDLGNPTSFRMLGAIGF